MLTLYKLLKLTFLYWVIIIVSASVIISYKNTYALPGSVIIYHLFFVGLVYLTGFVVGFFLLSLKKGILYAKCLFAAFLGIVFLAQLLVYILAFGGNELIKYPISISIFWVYISQFTSTIQAFSIPYWIAYLVCFFIPVCIIGCFVIGSNQLWSVLVISKQNLTINSNYRSKLSKGIVVLFSVTTFVLINYESDKNTFAQRLELIREPLYTVLIGDGKTGITLTNDDQVDKARGLYPKRLTFNKMNVILIVIDALRADYLPVNGDPESNTPFLSDLYKTGRLQKVDYSFATSTYSFPSILSILRSKYVPDVYTKTFSIQELLKDQGYTTNFILSGDHTNFYNLKSYYGTSIDYFFDGTNSTKFSINDDALVLEGLDGVNSYRNNPSFFYFHLMSVHPLGLRHESIKKYLPANVDFNKISYENNYKNGVLQADWCIKKIFEKLNQKGFLENSIVVITADHGESIGEKNIFAHGHEVSNREIHTPLLIYDNDRSVSYRTDHASQPDIAVTILDRLGLPVPPSWQGESLLEESKHLYSFHANPLLKNYAVIQYKNNEILEYYYDMHTKKEAIFDLKNDPGETNNLISQTNNQLLIAFRQAIKPALSSVN